METKLQFGLCPFEKAEYKQIKSLIRHNIPDYSLEITELDAIGNNFIDSSFFHLNYGDIFLKAYNAYTYYNDFVLEVLTSISNYKMQKENFTSGLKKHINYNSAHDFLYARDLAMLNVSICNYITEVENSFDDFSIFDSYIYCIENNRLEHHVSKINVTINYGSEFGQTEYTFNSMKDVIAFDYHEMIKRNKPKLCRNCDRLFIPITRSDEIYCDNIYKNGKTCKQLGYEIKVNNDEVLKTYRTVYKTQNARKQRRLKEASNQIYIQRINERFLDWSNYAKEKLQECQQGIIKLEEFKKLINSDNWLQNEGKE